MIVYFDKLAYALSLIKDGVLSVDVDGAVWRLAVRDRWGNQKEVKPRRAESPTHKGYLAVVLGIPGTRKTCKVFAHVLVWTHWHGPIPAGIQVNHKKPKEKANNKPSNLELMTQSENIKHSYENGRTKPWTRSTHWRGRPMLTDEDKAKVLELRRQGLGSQRINKLTGISKTHLERIFKKGGA